jgi:hypothetical protein
VGDSNSVELTRSDRFSGRSIYSVLIAAMLSAALVLAISPPARASRARLGGKADDRCPGGNLDSGHGQDIVIDTPCTVNAGTYHYGDINILEGGSLLFTDSVINFWTKSIIIQNGGAMLAGVANPGQATEQIVPIGTAGGLVTIHLYGKDQGKKGKAAVCRKKTKEGAFEYDKLCGITNTIFNTLGTLTPTTCKVTTNLPGHIDDCFYQYTPLKYDDGDGDMPGYFGYKSIGLSFGGTLRLYGKKGADYSDTDVANDETIDPANTGQSWVRLNNCPGKLTENDGNGSNCVSGVLQAMSTELKVSKAVTTWQPNDWIVLTSTDYVPAHSEQLQVKSVSTDGLTVTLQASTPLKFPHNASVYDLSSLAGKGLTDLTSVDTRAAVGLLTRSIRIVSEGSMFMEPLPPADSKSDDRYFGGHLIMRQGFQELQLQGAEFYQMGQGGRIGHYPIHFHLDRKVPANTFVKDCSIWDSMTRWIVVHATQGVLLARNVGYRSIGHGYFIEDGSETNNRLYANLGVSAIAAVDDTANYRKVPGILAYEPNATNGVGIPQVPYKTDFDQPTIFWSMNGWNDWEYNMAVGAETCGLCYWMVAGNVSGPSRQMKWLGYASEQVPLGNDGNAPIEKFVGNTCSTATEAFTDIADVTVCNGTQTGNARLAPIPNKLLPDPQIAAKEPKDRDIGQETYYPIVHGGTRHATLCPSDTADCSAVPQCANGAAVAGCAVTTLDQFTSSFTYAELNFAAVWLRPQWSLLINSAVTDALFGGVTFVTGGGYTRSDAIAGLWDLARKDVFIGNTQDPTADPYALNGGPVNPSSLLTCKNNIQDYNYCLALDPDGKDLGVLYQRSNLSMNQRMFNIYDGPFFEDSNAFLDITPTVLNDCDLTTPVLDKRCANSKWMEGVIPGVPGYFEGEDQIPGGCYLPNAAIAWKQPNGFYYPPAFHSKNLYFHNVDIRHYVIEPLFKPGTYKTDLPAARARYCNTESTMFDNFTDIDRQTELNDDDGSLTGFINTVSVNQDPFFNAPTQDVECRSDVLQNVAGTAKTSPYDYVTVVIYPEACKAAQTNAGPTCYDGGNPPASWYKDCANPRCYGVPLYRQLLNPGESAAPFIRMNAQGFGQRSTMIPNAGTYYIDTTVSPKTQQHTANLLNVFKAGETYHVLLLFAKPTTIETFQIFVGRGLSLNYANSISAERANLSDSNFIFTPLPWPAAEWNRGYDTGTGILTVTIDMNNYTQFDNDYTNSIPGRCQPVSMCKYDSGTSTCNCNITDSTNYLYQDCQADNSAICSSAIKDIDYPDGGAYGFSFTMPAGFVANDDASARPGTSCFPQTVVDDTTTPSPWPQPFAVASPAVAGDCYNDNPPSPQFCTNPP